MVSALLPASGYLSIPCCPWDFDARYERGRAGAFQVPQFDAKSAEHVAFVDGLGLGSEGQADTSYSKYRIWLAYLSRTCGWKVECEMLRIPSTRNWAILGRWCSLVICLVSAQHTRRIGRERVNQEAGHGEAQAILAAVRERNIFKTRTPEGKARLFTL